MQLSNRTSREPNRAGGVGKPALLGDGALGYRLLKRVFDILFAAIILMVMVIPGVILAIIIAIQSKGSPLYTQERIGQGGRPFRLIKFRSMVIDADNIEKYLDDNQLEQWAKERKVTNDPRITKVGRFIRRTSIDEIPQFINVLLGDMSVVGPRAITRDELIQWFSNEERTELLSVPQGITGWWQVQKRNSATFESGERQYLELWYVKNASLALDINIMLRTVGVMAKKTGV